MPKVAELIGWLLFRKPEGIVDSTAQWIDDEIAQLRAALINHEPLANRVAAARELMSTLIWRLLSTPAMMLAAIAAGTALRKLTGRSATELAPLGRGLDGNVTTEMDLAVGDLADTARKHQVLRDKLQAGAPLSELRELKGADEFCAELDAFLERYGARAPSEIDISRLRWREAPDSILSTIAGNLRGEAGTHRAHHAAMKKAAEELTKELIADARRGPFGFVRAAIVLRFIRVHRELLPIREHPKFMLVSAIDAIRTTALDAAEQLLADDRIDERDDVFFLDLNELELALRDDSDIRPVIAERKAAYEHHRALYPPRVMTSEGEIPRVSHATDHLPEGAIAGSAASSGIIEGIAHVIMDPTP